MVVGESTAETAGDCGSRRLGKEVAPVGGADMGTVGQLEAAADVGEEAACLPHLHEQSVRSLLAVEGMESCAESSSELELVTDLRISGATGDMALRKSM